MRISLCLTSSALLTIDEPILFLALLNLSPGSCTVQANGPADSPHRDPGLPRVRIAPRHAPVYAPLTEVLMGSAKPHPHADPKLAPR